MIRSIGNDVNFFRSHRRVIKIGQKHISMSFPEFLMTIICDIKIDLIMSEPHHVNITFYKPHPSIVKVFYFLTFDKMCEKIHTLRLDSLQQPFKSGAAPSPQKLANITAELSAHHIDLLNLNPDLGSPLLRYL